MANKSGNIGTATETAVVRVFQANGFPHVERRRLRGAKDCGDLTGIPGVVVEVKGGAAARTASDAQIEKWLDETAIERVNAGAQVGVLVVARKGIGLANADRWWAIMRTGHIGTHLTSTPVVAPVHGATVRLYLADALRMLRAAGYGDPLPAVPSQQQGAA